MKLLVLDGNSILNRAYYGIKLLTTKDGRYTNAVYGYMNIFLKLLADVRPDAVACAFDVHGKTFRHNMYDGYKANRKGMPEELAPQLPEVQELLKELGYNVVTCPGYEADDILGTLAAACDRNGDQCYIATGDRDSLQLISDNTTVLLATSHFGRGETISWTKEYFRENYGIEPSQFVDVKALMGDTSDNIPGVAGVGEKTALPLIQNFKDIDGVYANIDDPSIKKGVREKLIKDKDSAYLSRTLAEISREAPISTDIHDYERKHCDQDAVVKRLMSLEMPSILKKLDLDAHEQVALEEVPAEKEIRKTEAVPFAKGSFTGGSIVLDCTDKGCIAVTEDSCFTLTEDDLAVVLEDGSTEKKCRTAKPFWRFAAEKGITARNIVFDLEVAAYLINPASPDYTVERLSFEYGITPGFECEEYKGAGALFKLCEAVEKDLASKEMMPLLNDIELPLTRVLAYMEHEGFYVRTDEIREFGEMLEGKIAYEQKEIYLLAGRSFNINSPKQLGQVLFEEMDLPYGKKTKTGWSTDAKTLENLKSVHPIIEHILDYRTYAKLESTYVEGLIKAADEHGRIHTDFKQTEARTGRISSTNPNLQNIPVRTELGSEMRKFFTAGDGKILLDADYSQIELRVLASMSGDERMISAFNENRDIHTETACSIFRVPEEEVDGLLRRRAKAVNFGIVYGIGAYSLSQNTGVSMQEASQYIKDYFSTYSGVHAFLEKAVSDAEATGYVTTLFGRRRNIPELRNSNKQVQALGKRLAMNTPIQGTAADIIKLAMIRVSDRLASEKLDAKLILQVHDELIIESSLECADEAARVLKEEMENVITMKVPLLVEVGRGKTWYDAK